VYPYGYRTPSRSFICSLPRASTESARPPHPGDRALRVETADVGRLLPHPTTSSSYDAD
jgi:hypothetical protein